MIVTQTLLPVDIPETLGGWSCQCGDIDKGNVLCQGIYKQSSLEAYLRSLARFLLFHDYHDCGVMAMMLDGNNLQDFVSSKAVEMFSSFLEIDLSVCPFH